MNNTINNRKDFIINFIYFGIIIGLYYCIVKFALGFLFPFLFAAALAVFLQKPVNKLEAKLKIKARGPISVILVLLIVLAVVSLLFLAGAIIIDEVKNFFTDIFSDISSIETMIDAAKEFLSGLIIKLPASIRDNAANIMNGFFEKLSSGGDGSFKIDLSVLSAPVSGALVVLKSMPVALLSLLVTIISCFFMTADYEKIRDLVINLFPENKQKKVIHAKHTLTYGVGKMLKAYASIMLITFSEVFLGLYLLKLLGIYTGGYIGVIAFVTCIVDIIPVLGTGTVVIPWAVYCFFFGQTKMGIGLIVLYAVITVIRQIIEPKLVANQAGLPAIVTVMAMFVGARLFGTFGIIILPFTVLIVKYMYDEGIFGRKAKVECEKETASEAAEEKEG